MPVQQRSAMLEALDKMERPSVLDRIRSAISGDDEQKGHAEPMIPK